MATNKHLISRTGKETLFLTPNSHNSLFFCFSLKYFHLAHAGFAKDQLFEIFLYFSAKIAKFIYYYIPLAPRLDFISVIFRIFWENSEIQDGGLKMTDPMMSFDVTARQQKLHPLIKEAEGFSN